MRRLPVGSNEELPYYARFVGAGLADPPPSPFREAAGGVLLGSQRFIDRIRSLLDEQPEQIELPELGRLRQRPSLDEIAAATARHFGTDAANWSPRTRSDAAGRAVAAYLARRRFGYNATAAAGALGCRGPSSVTHAVRRIERGTSSLAQAIGDIERALR